MFKKEEDLNLSDLIDIKFLQEFQDNFAKAMNVASITVDDRGPITQPSNFSDFCSKYTRGSELGLQKCIECDIKWGNFTSGPREPLIYTCHTGLTDFAVPIVVEGKYLGTILGGQVLTEPPNEDSFRKVARELLIDENEYIEALKKIKIMPIEKVREAANLLHLVANSISEISHKNLELIKKNQKESFYRTITETIRSSLDIGETKKKVVEIVGKALNTDRCFIIEYDKKTDNFLPINDEYLSSDSIIHYRGVDVNKEAPDFAGALKDGKNIIINNKGISINEYNRNFDIEKVAIKKYEINSALVVPLYYYDKLLGALAVHYVKKEHYIGEEEIELLKNIANQVSIAIHQANLYKITQVQAEREKLIGDIIAKSLSTFDINQIKQIVNDVGRITKADRCYFIQVDLAENKVSPVDFEGEYLSSSDIKSIIGYDFPREDMESFIEMLLMAKDLVFLDYELIRQDKSEKYRGVNNYSTLFELKTGMGIPLFYMGELKAILGIGYVKEKVFPSLDELDFLRILGNQIGMAFNQILLYQDTKKTAESEKALRKIMLSSVSTFDLKEAIKSMVTEAGMLFKADRCFFNEVDAETDSNLPIKDYAEYLSSSDIRSHLTRQTVKSETEGFIKVSKQRKVVFVEDVGKIYLPDDTRQMLVDDLSVKSYLIVPVFYGDIMYGSLVLHYVHNYKSFNQNELDMAQAIANQSAIVIHQTQLYKQTQAQAEREILLRKIFETMRSSLAINDTKNKVVNAVGKALNADRCFITEYNSTEDCFYIDRYSEYLLSTNEKSFVGVNTKNFKKNFFVDLLRNHHEINYANIEDFIVENNLQNTSEERFLRGYGIKSSYSIPIYYANSLFGYIVIDYTNDYRKLDENEIEFLRLISTQAGIALYHSELYVKAQESARFKGEFIANMSHEIKTPLNIIIGFSDILSESQLEHSKQVEYLKNINKSGKHLLALTNDIINISKIESGNIELNYEKIDSGQLIMSVVSSIKLIADTKNINIEVDIIRADISADKKMLTQILYNLLNNALKFTPEMGRIAIKSEVDDDKLIVSVEDTGIGINSDEYDIIFEKFKQVDSSYTRRQQGAGLGLSIAKKIIEQHNGSIHVESIKGKGARFWFILPNASKIDAQAYSSHCEM